MATSSALVGLWRRAAVVGLAVAMMLAVSPSNAFGTESGVDTSVNLVSSGPSSVVIECIWALQDMVDSPAHFNTSTPPQRDDIDYFDANGNDDDQSDNRNAYPCDSDGTEAVYDTSKINDNGVNVGDAGGHLWAATPGVIEVRANAENLPAEQAIELWMAVDHPTANVGQIGSVFVDVLHPDGSYKVQVHLRPVNCVDPNVLLNLGYDTTTGTVVAGSMFDSAGSGGSAQVSLEAIKAPQGIHYRCSQGIKELYHGSFELSKHQPCGPYTLMGKASDAITNNVTLIQSWLYVECFVQLELDFDMGVTFPTTAVGGTSVIHGDLDFGTAGAPTIKNTGSDGMNISVAFTAMCGNTVGPLPCDSPAAKKATEFNAKFAALSSNFIGNAIMGSDSTAFGSGFTPSDGTGICAEGYEGGATIDTTFGAVVACPNSPNTFGDFGYGDYKTLCANELGKLDVSVLLPTGRDLASGMSLGGTMTVYAQSDRNTDGVDNTTMYGGQLVFGYNADHAWGGTPTTCNNPNGFDKAIDDPAFNNGPLQWPPLLTDPSVDQRMMTPQHPA